MTTLALDAALTPAQIALVGFLARYSGNTRTGYAYHLRNWFDWCATQNIDPLTGPIRAHVELYIRYRMEVLGNSASTIGTVMSPIRGYYRFAVIDGMLDRNPAEYAMLPKVRLDDSRLLGLSRHELTLFLVASEVISARHHAFAYLIGVLGLRVSEACNVQIDDYQHTAQGHRVLKLIGKGNKPATMPLPVNVLRALDHARGDRTQGYLLTTLDGRKLERHAAAGLVRAIAKRAKITKHVHPHMLRASAITAALDANVPLREVQYFARHEDPRVTMHYDRARGNLDRHAVHTLAAYVSV